MKRAEGTAIRQEARKGAFTVLIAVALLPGCATKPVDPDDIRQVVENSQKALVEHGDYATREFRLDGIKAGAKLTFHGSKVEVDSKRAELRHLAVIEVGDNYVEEVNELYVLRLGPDGWRITLNRYWLQRVGKDRFDEKRWKNLDAAVARCRKQKNLRNETNALWSSLRFPEMDTAKRWTTQDPTNVDAWMARGFGVAFVGDPDDSLLAFSKARALDANAKLPDYAQRKLRIRDKGAAEGEGPTRFSADSPNVGRRGGQRDARDFEQVGIPLMPRCASLRVLADLSSSQWQPQWRGQRRGRRPQPGATVAVRSSRPELGALFVERLQLDVVAVALAGRPHSSRAGLASA